MHPQTDQPARITRLLGPIVRFQRLIFQGAYELHLILGWFGWTNSSSNLDRVGVRFYLQVTSRVWGWGLASRTEGICFSGSQANVEESPWLFGAVWWSFAKINASVFRRIFLKSIPVSTGVWQFMSCRRKKRLRRPRNRRPSQAACSKGGAPGGAEEASENYWLWSPCPQFGQLKLMTWGVVQPFQVKKK